MVNPTISDPPSSDSPSAARTMRSIATCIVGLTLAVNLVEGSGSYSKYAPHNNPSLASLCANRLISDHDATRLL